MTVSFPEVLTDQITDYAVAVVEGRVPVGRLARLACARHLRDMQHGADRGLWFDQEEAVAALGFIESLPQRKGEWQGRPLTLEPWQRFRIGSVFGWKREDGTRRFRKAFNEVGRKNGKTTEAAAVGNLLAWGDGEPGAEVYCVATKRDQSKICWSEAKWQLEYAAAGKHRQNIASMLGVNLLVANMQHPESASKMEPLGADQNSGDSINPHAYIIDELHAWKDREYWGKLQTAMGARRQPLTWIITTAGDEGESIYGDEHDYAVQVLEDVIQDDGLFAYIAAIDDPEQWGDPDEWIKANPNLGVSLKEEYLRQQYTEALGKPATQAMFKRMHCGVRTASETPWIAMDLWNGQDQRRELDDLEGELCYAGLDLSSKIDMTALVLWFPDGPDAGDLHAWYFVPEDTIEERTRKDRVPYGVWAAAGHVIPTPGASVDYEYIEKLVSELRERFDLHSIAKDPWNGADLERRLEASGFTEEDGCPVIDVPQNYGRLSDATKEIERLLRRRGLRHGGNPVLRWNAQSAVAVMDANENVKLDKRRSKERIDGLAATVNAMTEATRPREPEVGWSVYVGEDE